MSQAQTQLPYAVRSNPRVQARDPELVPVNRMTERGVVKWYDHIRRFGFIVRDDGQEVFLHQSDLQKYGLRESRVFKDVQVKFLSRSKAGQRPEVYALALA
jgi:cold shock protein